MLVFSKARFIHVFLIERRLGLPVNAILSASASKILRGTTASTMPYLRACFARTDAPVSIILMACCKLIKRGKRCVPVLPGNKPSCTSGKPNTVLASSEHTRA